MSRLVATGAALETPRASMFSRTWQRVLSRLPERLLFVAALVVLLSYAIIALAHVRDRYQVNFVSGVYAGLAMHLNSGTFYPPLYDGATYGGTRYMPLQFSMHAGLAQITGEYLFSGKLLTCFLAVALFSQLYFIGRKLQCGRSVALALASLVVLTDPGLTALTTIRGDLLPVVLQLGAIQFLLGGTNWRRILLGGTFCTLALLAKVSAIWAAIAIIWHLSRSQKRRAVGFAGFWILTTAAAVFALNALSDGRMLLNMGVFSGSGVSVLDSLIAPLAFLWRVAQSGALLTLLVPLVLFGWIRAAQTNELGLIHRAFATGLLTTLGVYLDKEVTNNHLLDLMVLCVPVLASLWALLPRTQIDFQPAPRTVLALALLWGVYMAFGTTLLMPTFEVIQQVRHGESARHHPARPLDEIIGTNDSLLCEDPWLAISRGQLPTVLDPYSLGRMSQNRPQLVQPLIERINNHDFQWIVVCQDMDDQNLLDRHRWEDRHFGPTVVRAMRRNYSLFKRINGHFVYVPRPQQLTDARDIQ